MSNKELERLGVIKNVIDKRLKQSQSSKILKLSIRQVKRLCRNCKKCGRKEFVSKKRGKSSNNILPNNKKTKC